MDKITKSPTEYFPVDVNFSNDLSSGENLASYTIACIDMDTGVSSATTVVASSSRSGNIVTPKVQAGSFNALHKVTIVGTSDLGNDFEKDFYLAIRKVIAGEFSKQPADEFSIKVDFEEDLRSLTSEEIVSVTQVVLDENGIDQAATLFPGEPFIDGDSVYIGVQGGSDGLYEIHITATTTSSYVFDIYVRMRIEER